MSRFRTRRFSVSRLVFGVALVLALAAALVCIGWAGGAGASGAEAVRADVAGLGRDVAASTQAMEERLNARLDRIEGKIDVLLKIATAQPPDMSQHR